MSWRHSGLIVLVLVALLVGACGPLPTDSAAPAGTTQVLGDTDTPAPVFGDTPVPATAAPEGPAAGSDGATDPDNYNALGAPDAPVTIIEYSDFQ